MDFGFEEILEARSGDEGFEKGEASLKPAAM